MKKKKKVFAPLKVIHYEWIYLLWVAFLLFGLLETWKGIFSIDSEMILSSIKNGTLCTFSISICVPFIVEFLISITLDKQKKNPTQFIKYKTVSLIIDFLWIMILIGIWLGAGKNCIWLQIVTCIFSLIFAFYMYCIEKMSNHYSELKEFDDEYLDNQKKSMTEIKEKASNTTNIGGIAL